MVGEFSHFLDRFNTIQLPPEGGGNSSSWIALRADFGSVEGKLHRPKTESRKLLIFEPGFPGDGSTRLEKIWLSKLLESGYTVFAARHCGTKVNGKHSAIYLNCPERQAVTTSDNDLLGLGTEFTIADWLKEPQVSLKILSPFFENIYLMGHSFGPLALFNSLIEFFIISPEEADKVQRIISLAGTLGRIKRENDPILEQWRKYMSMPIQQEKIAIGEVEKNIEILKQVYSAIHTEFACVPTSTDLIFVNAWGRANDSEDELVSPIGTLDFLLTTRRGAWLIDAKEQADPQQNRLAHDMENLTGEELLNLIEGEIEPGLSLSLLS